MKRIAERMGRGTVLCMAAAFLLAGCGKKIHGPSYVGHEEHHWWQFWGDRYPATNAHFEHAAEIRSLKTFRNDVPAKVILHIALPDELISSGLLKDYTKRTGVGFQVSVFSTDQEFFRLLETNKQVHLALVPGRLAEELIREDRLERLDHAVIPRLTDLDWPKPVGKFFTRDLPYDRGNKFAVPYLAASIGIAYNREFLPQGVPSLGHFFQPEKWTPDELTNSVGRILLLNDPQLLVASALLGIGEDPNSTNALALERASQAITRLQPLLFQHGTNLANMDRLAVARALGREQVVAALATTGDATLAMKLNSSIDFKMPAEGSILMIENLVIPKSPAKRLKRHAEEFINHLLDPVVASSAATISRYASASQEAKAFLPREVLRGPAYKMPYMDQRRILLATPEQGILRSYDEIFGRLSDSPALPN